MSIHDKMIDPSAQSHLVAAPSGVKSLSLNTVVCTALLIFSGLQLSDAPNLFVADLIALSSWPLILLCRSRYALNVLLFIALIAISGISILVCLDVRNGLGTRDVVSAVFRNGVFLSCTFAAVWTGLRYGLRSMFGIYAAVGASLSLYLLMSGRIPGDFTLIVKYGNFMGVISLIAWLLAAPKMPHHLSAFFLAASGVALFIFASARGQGAITFAAGCFGIWKTVVQTKLQRTLLLAAFVSIGLVASPYIQRQLDDSKERNEYSNGQRLRMAQDAWVGFKEQPFRGHGTFSHAAQYVDIANPQLTKGVHSMILQFAYEYGIVGMAAGLVTSLTGGLAIVLVAGNRVQRFNSRQAGLVALTIFSLIYDSVNSPFFTISRFNIGLQLGICITLILLSFQPTARSKR